MTTPTKLDSAPCRTVSPSASGMRSKPPHAIACVTRRQPSPFSFASWPPESLLAARGHHQLRAERQAAHPLQRPLRIQSYERSNEQIPKSTPARTTPRPFQAPLRRYKYRPRKRRNGTTPGDIDSHGMGRSLRVERWGESAVARIGAPSTRLAKRAASADDPNQVSVLTTRAQLRFLART